MGISCECDFDGDGDGWVYSHAVPLDFKPLATKRAHRCCSCHALVKPGADIVELERYRNARNDIEERIYGEGCDVPMASWILCEECGGLYMAIQELDICWIAGTNIKDDVQEWAEATRHYKKISRTTATSAERTKEAERANEDERTEIGERAITLERTKEAERAKSG